MGAYGIAVALVAAALLAGVAPATANEKKRAYATGMPPAPALSSPAASSHLSAPPGLEELQRAAPIKRDDNYTLIRLTALAAKGDPSAQFLLARMYSLGRGVRADAKLAFRWMIAAARGRIAAAHYHLGLMYLAGEQVRYSIVEAYARFRVAADRGDVRAPSLLFHVGVHMSASELRQAHARVRDIKQDIAASAPVTAPVTARSAAKTSDSKTSK